MSDANSECGLIRSLLEPLPLKDTLPTTTKTSYLTYVTSIGYPVPTINGIAGADALCNSNAGKPPGSSTYKALLVDESGGVCGSNPCRRASITANLGDGQIDWVLKPNVLYTRSNGTSPIFTTNANSLFIFGALTTSWTDSPLVGVSGMSTTWTVFPGFTCTNYTLNSGSVTTANYSATNTSSLSSATLSCGANYYLLCIEQ
ncbi:DUF1554 domain-containing protein [Leptospira jelokensis]|uniref:DUF1554 domain-containing protein n=1 Tax=Leptospira jelokensis TaxID=2484931 RepID=UPI001FD09C22|nr:DUF1554 domain-containing protein [Leptospira jelokensis]